jgi:hypothetical protein
VVHEAWNMNVNSVNVLDIWPSKLSYFRKLAKGWSANLYVDIKNPLWKNTIN